MASKSHLHQLLCCVILYVVVQALSQRGGSPFVYRSWPASLPYIQKSHVSVAIHRTRLHERVPRVKIWGSSENDQNWTTEKLLKLLVVLLLLFQPRYLKNCTELRNKLCIQIELHNDHCNIMLKFW